MILMCRLHIVTQVFELERGDPKITCIFSSNQLIVRGKNLVKNIIKYCSDSKMPPTKEQKKNKCCCKHVKKVFQKHNHRKCNQVSNPTIVKGKHLNTFLKVHCYCMHNQFINQDEYKICKTLDKIITKAPVPSLNSSRKKTIL